MRTKESAEFEKQESTWIYLLHQQAPPQTRLSAEASLALPPLGATATDAALFGAARPAPILPSARSLTLRPSPAMMLSSQDKTWEMPSSPLPHLRDLRAARVTPKQLMRSSSSSSLSSLSNGNNKRACFPKKCDFPMCQNSSRSRGFCYSHGGGRRCRVDGCSNGAVSRDLCKRHGGGRRCRIAGCKSSSESGGLCYSHGGGRRCSLAWCSARAKKGGFCAVHLNGDRTPPGKDAAGASGPSGSGVVRVLPNVVETLLSLAKDQTPVKQEVPDVVPTTPSAGKSAYAIASILN